MATSCLDNIIGLDRTECDCFPDAPSGFNTSTSGYFMTDPEYGVPMKDGILANAGCGEDDLWAVLANTRSRAIDDFQIDLRSVLDEEKKPAFTPWNGVINRATANRSKTISKAFAGNVIKPLRRQRHQKLVITALYLGIDFTGDVTVRLNSNKFGFTELTATVAAISGQFVKYTLPTAWELDLYQAEVPDLYYTISFATGGNTIRDNKINCTGCGGRPSWTKHIKVYGFSDDAATRDFSDTLGGNTEAQGLAFEAYLDCGHLDFICELNQLGGKEMKSLIGRGVQHKSTVKLLHQILESDKINQWTLLNVDAAYAKMNLANDLYNNVLRWIAQNLPDGVSGCYSCSTDVIRSQPIFV